MVKMMSSTPSYWWCIASKSCWVVRRAWSDSAGRRERCRARLAQWRRSRSVRDRIWGIDQCCANRRCPIQQKTSQPMAQAGRAIVASTLGALGLGVPWAIRIGAVIELADEFDWAFKGVEMAIAMIADMHHAPASSAIPIQHVKFPESEVGVGWPAVGHRIDLRGVPVGLHVLLNAEQKDTKQPCSVLASFLAR